MSDGQATAVTETASGAARGESRLAGAVVIAGALLVCYWTLAKVLFLPWFWFTEEAPYAQEALRFLSGDFRQQFFDIPGTPFIGLGAVIMKGWLAASSVLSGRAEGPFDHLDLLYSIMRVVSSLAFVGAGWFMFLTARQIASTWAAVLAGLVLVFHPIITPTMTHIRIEPFGVFLVTASLYCFVRAVHTGSRAAYAMAGLLAGLAMAARFQLALACVPVFVVFAMLRPTRYPQPARLDRWLVLAVGAFALAGGAAALIVRRGVVLPAALTNVFFLTGDGSLPLANGVIARLWMAVATAVVLAAVFAAIRPAVVRRYLDSSLASSVGWFVAGVLIGVPTLFTSGIFFLRSVEMFVGRNAYVPAYQDSWIKVLSIFTIGQDWRAVTSWAPIGEVGPLFTIPLILLFLAAFFGKARPRLLFWCIVLACSIGIVSQFGKLQTSRHIAGWLPWFCLMIAIGFDAIRARLAAPGLRAAVAAGVVLLVSVQMATATQRRVQADILALTERLPAQIELQRYASTLPPDATVFYACCSGSTTDMMTVWLQKNGVKTPTPTLENVELWFGDLSSVRRAGDGYVVLRDGELGGIVDYFRQVNPSEMIDPENDDRFHRVQWIPINPVNGFSVYQFSFTGELRRPSGGIDIIEASYGVNCSNDQRQVRAGNVTSFVKRSCNRKDACSYAVNVAAFGVDPAHLCAKDFVVRWRCEDGQERTAGLPPEAHGHTIELACPATSASR